jgi:hypothetical protein
MSANRAYSSNDISELHALSKSNCFIVRVAVAQNDATSPHTLHLLAEDKHYYIRACVAMHPNVFVRTLRELVNDESDVVRAIAKKGIKR